MKNWLLCLLLLLPTPALAGITFRTATNCTTTACTSASPMFCQTSTYTTTVYVCDTAVGYYVAVSALTYSGQIVVPDCPSVSNDIKFGAICKSPQTGKMMYRDAGGVKELP